MNVKRLAWWVARSRLGWPGAAAFFLLALAIAAQFVLLRPLQARIDTVASPAMQRHAANAGSGEPAQRLEQFHRHLRDAGSVTDQLARLNRIAAAHGVRLPRGEYRLVGEAGAPLRQYEVTFPIAAPYPSIRAFLAEALDQLPAVALEQVTFERKRIGDAGVEAQVRLTLYVEP
jgi:hypothetical protein